MQDARIYDALTRLRLPLILCVVLIHSNIMPYLGDGASLFRAFHRHLDQSVLLLAVPAFFALSGFLYFRDGLRLDKAGYICKSKTRLHTLLIPYLLWNTLGLLIFIVKCHLHYDGTAADYGALQYSLQDYLAGYILMPGVADSPYDFPLWYLRNLIIISAVAPLISMLIRRMGAYALPVLIIAVTTYTRYCPDPLRLGGSLIFFTAGVIIACRRRPLLASLPVSAAATAYILMYLVETAVPGCDNPIFNYIRVISGVLLIFRLATRYLSQDSRPGNDRAATTYFIYAGHGLVSAFVLMFICRVLPPVGTLLPFIDYTAVFTIQILLTLAAGRLLRRRLPAFYSVLTGG